MIRHEKGICPICHEPVDWLEPYIAQSHWSWVSYTHQRCHLRSARSRRLSCLLTLCRLVRLLKRL